MHILLRKKPLMFGMIATTLVSGGTIYAYENYKSNYPRNLNDTLSYYGFETNEQKQAFRSLIKQYGVKDVDNTLDNNKNPKELCKTIIDLNMELQSLKNRPHMEDRWNADTKRLKDSTENLSSFKTLGMSAQVLPTIQNPDAMCILGSTSPVMAARLAYAGELYNQGKLPVKEIILLAGERYVTPNKNDIIIDGSIDELSKVANKFGKTVTELTETQLIIYNYKHSELYNKFKNHVIVIDTPRGNLPRPTTQTTVAKLAEVLQQHPEIKKIIFVSNQPYVYYQKAIIAEVFENLGVKVEFDVIGAEYKYNVGTNNIADKVMQELIGRFWASTPGVLKLIESKMPSFMVFLDLNDPQIIEKLNKLYGNQPLIYDNLIKKTQDKQSRALRNT